MRKLLFLIALVVVSSITNAQELPFKVAYADIEYILSKMPDMADLNERLTSTQAKLQADYEAKRSQFQKQYEEYAANMKTMADTTRVNEERKLQLLNRDLQQFPQEAKTTLDNSRMLWMAPIYLKVGKAIETVAIESGYTIILPTTVSGMELLLYSDASRNVSDLVLAKFGVTAAPADKK